MGAYLLAEGIFIDSEALIVQGAWIGIEEASRWTTYLALGATFLSGYNSIYKSFFRVRDFSNEIANPEYKIFFFTGHGTITPSLYVDRGTWATGEDIKKALSKRGKYKFVFISSCHSIDGSLAEVFRPHCDSFLGYKGKAYVDAEITFEEAFWVWVYNGKTIGEAVNWGKRRVWNYYGWSWGVLSKMHSW
jgi:hypothetical protein